MAVSIRIADLPLEDFISDDDDFVKATGLTTNARVKGSTFKDKLAYIKAILIADWITVSDNKEIDILKTTHGRSNPVVEVYRLISGTNYKKVTVEYSSDSGDVKLTIPDALAGFDGKVVIL